MNVTRQPALQLDTAVCGEPKELKSIALIAVEPSTAVIETLDSRISVAEVLRNSGEL